jgi:hypothetical protein
MAQSHPIKASHRLMRYISSVFLKGDFDPKPEEFDLVSRVFVKAGGSWEKLYKGSADELVLLKRAMRVAAKDGHLSRKERS